jgi:hypothetical protein
MIVTFDNFLLEYLNRNDITIQKGIFDESEKVEATKIATEFFQKFGGYDNIYSYIYNNVDFDISILAKYEDEIIGCLLLSVENFNAPIRVTDKNKEILDFIEDKKGVEGFALAVKTEYQKTFAVYKMLYELTQMKQFDYVWLMQYDELRNSIKYDNKTVKVGSFGGGSIYIRLLK